MSDMEKVIKALEYCTHSDDCIGCIHWQKVAKGEKCTVRDDALALLKEQEAVEPVLDSFLHKRCPSCRALLNGKFCHECGQELKLE